eukprot:2829851-Pyramimonas_sp.AAC.1
MFNHANFTQTEMKAGVVCQVQALGHLHQNESPLRGVAMHLLLNEGVGVRAHNFAAAGVYRDGLLDTPPLDPAGEFWVLQPCPTYGPFLPHTVVTGSDLEETVAGEPSYFVVEAHDRCGFKERQGGANFAATITGPLHLPEPMGPTDLSVTDLGDGSYVFTFSEMLAGFYNIQLTLDGVAYHEVFATYVNPNAADVTHSYIYHNVDERLDIDGLFVGHAGLQQSYKLQVVDEYYNLRTAGGDSVEVFFAGPTHLGAEVHDNDDGTYTIRYLPRVSGNYTMSVELCGTPVCIYSDTAAMEMVQAPSPVIPSPPPPPPDAPPDALPDVERRRARTLLHSLYGRPTQYPLDYVNTSQAYLPDLGKGLETQVCRLYDTDLDRNQSCAFCVEVMEGTSIDFKQRIFVTVPDHDE